MDDGDTSNNLIPTAGNLGDDAAAGVEVLEILIEKNAEEQLLPDRICQVIEQINENKRSRIPQNMDLISELESNIEKLVQLYSILSANVSALVEQCLAKAEAARKSKNIAP